MLNAPGRSRSVVGGGLVVCVGVGWLLLQSPPESPPRLRLVQRLHAPIGVADIRSAPGRLAAISGNRWTADQIDAQWVKVDTPASATYRSPRLDLETADDLQALVVTLPRGAPGNTALLLWNDRPTFSREDYLRNRRDLLPRLDRPATIVIPGKDLRGRMARPVRYLFLHIPESKTVRGIVDSIAVASVSDLTAAAPAGRAQIIAGGEAREVVFMRGAGEVSFAIEGQPGAELLFGLHPLTPAIVGRGVRRASRDGPSTDAHAGVRARVIVAADGRDSVVFDRLVEGARWHDFRAPLPAVGKAVVRLSALGASKDAPYNDGGTPYNGGVFWSTPIVVAPEERLDRPNVILYVVDTLRADRLGLYGAPRSPSPVLDGLAKRSLVARRAYSAASWTKPSVTTLLTSLHPQTHRIGGRYYGDPLPTTAVTLQDMLAAQGYLTALFTSNPFTGTASNLDQGFDRSVMPDAFEHATTAETPPKITADEMNARILPWIDAHARDRFFLYVQSFDPHAPLDPGATLDAYNAAISSNDREIGRLYQRLVDLGLASRTLFIVAADHGEAFGEHGQSGHGSSVYDEEVRVPLLLHWPGTIAPGWVEHPVHLVDLMPTILVHLGIPFARDQFQGRRLESRATAEPDPVFVSRFTFPDDLDADRPNRGETYGVVAFPWKLIATDAIDAPRRLELYDLSADPLERRDVARAQPAQVRRLEASLHDFLREQADARARFLAEHGGTAAPPRRLPAGHVMEQLKRLGDIR